MVPQRGGNGEGLGTKAPPFDTRQPARLYFGGVCGSTTQRGRLRLSELTMHDTHQELLALE